VLVSAVTGFILLLAMIIGVIRLGLDSPIWRIMVYRHGMAWVLLATFGHIPPAVLLFLNFNEPMNLMFQPPSLVIMTICVTRFYRSLATFGGHQPAVFDSFLACAPLVSNQPTARGVCLPPGSSTPSVSTGSGLSGINFSLEEEFPTSYGRYRTENLEQGNDRLKAINEEGEECESEKANMGLAC